MAQMRSVHLRTVNLSATHVVLCYTLDATLDVATRDGITGAMKAGASARQRVTKRTRSILEATCDV